MRKLSFLILGALSSFAFILSVPKSVVAAGEEKTVYVGGMPAGFTLKAGGAQIIGTCEVMTDSGVFSPATAVGLRSGDKITKINGIIIETIEQLNKIINNSGGKSVEMEIIRRRERQTLDVTPVKDKITGHYKIGVLARDSVSGIGTVTYIDKEEGKFASLGHSVVGEDKRQLNISNGVVYECNIIGVNKGVRGKAGELRGMFINNKTLGEAKKLCDCGIFGVISEQFDYSLLQKVVASSQTVMPGDAYIYSTVNGICPQKYEIEIVKVDKFNKENKNYVIKITDGDLIAKTGGIVQGMSGSPILQNGKIVGAVTHVFLNDPTRGYGIDIQTMLNE